MKTNEEIRLHTSIGRCYDLRPSPIVTDRSAPTIPRSHEPRRSCRRLRPTNCLATVPQMRPACRRRRRTRALRWATVRWATR
eukprot:scaffold10991_cov35-Phaeocystis_antarctica.AAC.2